MAVKTNVTINGNDYYRITVDLGRDSNGKRIRKQFLGKSKKEAEKKRDEFLNNQKLGITNDKIYLGKHMEEWFWEIVRNDGNIKISTFDRNYRTYNKYLKDSPLSNIEIKKISNMDIQKYYNSLHDSGKPSATIRGINKVLKTYFNYCINADILIKNPCKKVVIPRDTLAKKQEEIITFTREEIKKIINANETSKIKCIALISLGTGMRLGEILGLTKDNVDFENNIIHVKQALTTTYLYDKDKKRNIITLVDVPKTKNSIRDIKINDDLKKVIKIGLEIKRKEIQSALKNGNEYNLKYKDFIFTGREGKLMRSGNIEKSWRFFLKRCGIEHKKFHALRHTFATVQYDNDVQLLTISKVLGHSSVKTTEIYAHVTDKSKGKIINILNDGVKMV